MGAVKNTLIDLTFNIISHFKLTDDEQTFDQVEQWITENVVLTSALTIGQVYDSFKKAYCPQCETLGAGAHCSCFTLDMI